MLNASLPVGMLTFITTFTMRAIHLGGWPLVAGAWGRVHGGMRVWLGMHMHGCLCGRWADVGVAGVGCACAHMRIMYGWGWCPAGCLLMCHG